MYLEESISAYRAESNADTDCRWHYWVMSSVVSSWEHAIAYCHLAGRHVKMHKVLAYRPSSRGTSIDDCRFRKALSFRLASAKEERIGISILNNAYIPARNVSSFHKRMAKASPEKYAQRCRRDSIATRRKRGRRNILTAKAHCWHVKAANQKSTIAGVKISSNRICFSYWLSKNFSAHFSGENL